MSYKTFEVHGLTVDPNTWSEEYRQHLLQYSTRVIMQRCTASVDGNTDPSKGPLTTKKEAWANVRAKTAANIKNGVLPTKGSGGGSKASLEARAERQVVADVLHNSFGYGKVEAALVAKGGKGGQDLQGWNVLLRHYLIEEAKESGEDPKALPMASLITEENAAQVASMHEEEYLAALEVLKGGTKKVATTGFLKAKSAA